ncbi:MAG TPA: YaiI/YqxD family protein [Desulfuromonadales bacterium]|nr:YaiI/YqxD family protein [Desulfuromonadales bacterium]
MQIWVDADACPRVIREILFRAAQRQKVPLIMVANQPLQLPASPWISMRVVAAGFDVADDKIVALLNPGDLVVTADIPLAAAVVKKGGHALNPRGEFYTPDNIQERLAIRDMLDELRGAGLEVGGPAAFTLADRQAFANQLDRFLAQHAKNDADN